MGKLLFWGLVGSAFFSSSFVLYELMSVQGGHWFWSASFRCLFMFLLLTVIIFIQNKGNPQNLMKLYQLFRQFWQFWCLTGGIGFGTYGLLAFSADYASGWVIASTFLFTVVASLFVLSFFGQSFNKKVIFFSVMVFLGVILANLGEGLHQQTTIHTMNFQTMLIFGAVPAFIASFCFPIGNQLIWQAGQEKNQQKQSKLFSKLPYISSPLLSNPLHKVWLMSLGSLPMWLILTFIIRPPPPSLSQINISFMVALLAGVLGTSAFLYARSLAKTPQQIAGVDATQGSEIIFSLIGGMVLLNTPMPTLMSIIGIVLVILGLVLFAKHS